MNLGPEGEDPTLPALEFLRDYCHVLQNPSASSGRYTYYRMLPGYGSPDCQGATDFFSPAALDALQSPLLVDEILARKERVAARWAAHMNDDDDDDFMWIDGTTPVTSDHLQWAVWLITSRVLTVQPSLENGGRPCRLLIPYLGGWCGASVSYIYRIE